MSENGIKPLSDTRVRFSEMKKDISPAFEKDLVALIKKCKEDTGKKVPGCEDFPRLQQLINGTGSGNFSANRSAVGRLKSTSIADVLVFRFQVRYVKFRPMKLQASKKPGKVEKLEDQEPLESRGQAEKARDQRDKQPFVR